MRNSIKLLIAVLLMFAMLTLASCGTTPDVTTDTTVDNGGDVVVEDNASIELVDGEVFAYNNEGERVNYNNAFVTINGDVYYAVNNIIVYNQVIINESVYDFGNDGKMVTGTKGDYTYGKDGKLVGGEGVFVTINGDVYCVINNVIVYNQVIVNGAVYNFGDDGKMITGEYGSYKYGEDGKLIANEMFVVINGDIYFVVNNAVVYNRVIIDGFVYDFGDDGKMVTGQKGDYKYGKDGKLVADEIFIEINGDVYFVVNNVIIYNQIIINNDSFYCFDEEGKMVTGEKDGKTYGEDGKLLGNELFVEINGDVYFLINNVIVYNQFIFNGNIYDFGDDGKMVTGEKDGYTYDEEGKLVGNEIFVTINGDVYFIINNVVIYNQIIINGDSFYRFDEEGKMVTGQYGDYTYGEDGKLVGNEIFVTINGNVYFIINNVIVYNQIVINGAVYDFGDDGKVVRDTVKDGYTYGGDGKLVGNEIFIEINGDVYFVVNNVIIYNQIIINNDSFYCFDEEGKMVTGEKDGKTYGEDGKFVGNEIFVEINGDVYFVVNNVIIYNQIIINGYVYDFGEDGKMVVGEKNGNTYGEDGRLVGNKVFVTINGDVYYIVNNVIIYNTYIIHDGKVYYITSTGTRFENGTHDGYNFGADGYIEAENVTITINGVTHQIINNQVANINFAGTVFESDNDFTLENNNKLANVQVSLNANGTVYTATTDASGRFEITGVSHATSYTLTFTLNGYITATATVYDANEELEIVMDRQVSNNLTGTIYIADTDSTITNNSPLAGALVTLTRTSSTNSFYYETTTNSNGYYAFANLTAGVYTLTVSKDGYISVTQTVQVRYNETTVNNVAIEAIPNTSEEGGYASGYITEALRGSAVSGLTVYIYSGLNTTFGEYIEVLTTDANGYYATSQLAPGNYTAYVVDERTLDDEAYRYASVTIALKVLPGQTSTNQNATVSNSVGLDIDGMRIVLTWGSSPSDLDSHLTYGSTHCYYSNKNTTNAKLDVDDTSAYGPETITITDTGSYTFNYYIYNYSNYGTMYNSQACVKVYFGNSSTPAYTFYPPQGSGYTWNVFTYNALTGEFTILNTVR